MPTLADLPQKDADRLVKLAGLLGSDHDGERANAARMATDLLSRNGLTWRDALRRPALPRPAATSRAGWQAAAVYPVHPMNALERQTCFCLGLSELFNDWERDFLASMLNRRNPTAKQVSILADLYAKAKRHAARAGADA